MRVKSQIFLAFAILLLFHQGAATASKDATKLKNSETQTRIFDSRSDQYDSSDFIVIDHEEPQIQPQVFIPSGFGVTDPDTYPVPKQREPNMGTLNGYLFRINYDVPKHAMKIFHKLYQVENLKYEDIPIELLKYEVKGDDIPKELRERLKIERKAGMNRENVKM